MIHIILCFEKMLDFATNNNLDIVSCGYDTIDAKTGKLIMRRALDRNLIISGENTEMILYIIADICVEFGVNYILFHF